jgi:3D (Asp-Asp-Asp) domain-containing protein
MKSRWREMKLGQEKGICIICAYAVIVGIFFLIAGIVHGNDDIDKKDVKALEVEVAQQEQVGVFTAYTACIEETDSDPTITASNQVVRVGIVANNCLPFGTKIKVKNKIYEVQDRMNARYGCNKFDIYMCEYSEAINFGIRELEYEII